MGTDERRTDRGAATHAPRTASDGERQPGCDPETDGTSAPEHRIRSRLRRPPIIPATSGTRAQEPEPRGERQTASGGTRVPSVRMRTRRHGQRSNIGPSPTISRQEPDAGTRTMALCAGNASRWKPTQRPPGSPETGSSPRRTRGSPIGSRVASTNTPTAMQPERPAVCAEAPSNAAADYRSTGRLQVGARPRTCRGQNPAQSAALETSTRSRSPRPGKKRVTRLEPTAATTATAHRRAGRREAVATSGDLPGLDRAARRPARAAIHRNPIVSTIGTRRSCEDLGRVADWKPGAPCTVAITSARTERRAVSSPTFAHDQSPRPPSNRCCARASTWHSTTSAPNATAPPERRDAEHRSRHRWSAPGRPGGASTVTPGAPRRDPPPRSGSSPTAAPTASQRLRLRRRGAGGPGHDRAGVTHALARRGLEPGDVADDRLRHLLRHECRGSLLVVAADLARQHDQLGLRVGLEELQRLHEPDPVDRDRRPCQRTWTGRCRAA